MPKIKISLAEFVDVIWEKSQAEEYLRMNRETEHKKQIKEMLINLDAVVTEQERLIHQNKTQEASMLQMAETIKELQAKPANIVTTVGEICTARACMHRTRITATTPSAAEILLDEDHPQ